MSLRKWRKAAGLLLAGMLVVGQASAFTINGDTSGWSWGWGTFKEAICDYLGFPGLCGGPP